MNRSARYEKWYFIPHLLDLVPAASPAGLSRVKNLDEVTVGVSCGFGCSSHFSQYSPAGRLEFCRNGWKDLRNSAADRL